MLLLRCANVAEIETCSKVFPKFGACFYFIPITNMTSNITDASQDELINLIYHHLKDNGYKKAANVLRKHAPQVETEEVKASLSEIFKKWASSCDGDIPPVPSGVRTAKGKKGSSTGTKSKITAPSTVGPKKSVNNKETSALANKSTKRKQKEAVTKTRKRKKSTSEANPGNDSDSDSSLDVEKWRKMVFQLSDVDRAMMDVLSTLDESPVPSPVKSSAKRRTTKKPARAKKEETPAKKGKSKTPAKKATAQPDNIPVTNDESETPSKKSKGKDAAAVSEHHEIKTPSKKAGNKKNSSISGPDVVKTPKRTKGKTTNSSVQDETEKPEANNETNGLLETGKMATPLTRTKEVNVSDSEANSTPKRVHFKKKSFSEQVETPKIANRKDNGTSENSSTETASKKPKKKKGPSEANHVETDSSPSNIKGVKKAASELLETDLISDQSETPSKKVKNKKSKSVEDPVPHESPSKKVKAKKTEGPSEIDQETTSEKADVSVESVKLDSSSKKAKLKANKIHSETVEPETPSKKAKAKKVKSTEEPGEVETTSKKLKTSDADIPQSDFTNSVSKKSKRKAADDVEIQNDAPSETPLKNSTSQAKTLEGDGLDNEETSSHDLKTPSKKRKHKREEACDVPAAEEATPEPKKVKKDKEKKKSKEGENADALQPPAAAAEEEAASVPVEIIHKKKKKKKEKEREEETEEIIPEDPPESAPVEEVVVHKKKKKSSKEKQLSTDETHGLNST